MSNLGIDDFIIINRFLEIMPVVLTPVALWSLLRAAKSVWNMRAIPGDATTRFMWRARSDRRLVNCLLLLAFEVATFLATQVFWVLFLLTDDIAYRVMFAFTRAVNGNVFMLTMIVIGRLVYRGLRQQEVEVRGEQ